jgi:predicted Zn-ribbon and HTH transcriptional regulator
MNNREQWLKAAVAQLAVEFKNRTGHEIPPVLISVGFPSKNPLGRNRRSIGQCWPRICGATGENQIFISPVIENATEVLAIVVHELCHAIDDCANGHKKPFIKLARAMLLEGKITATVAGDAFKREIVEAVLVALGKYPHGALTATGTKQKAQSTRMIRCKCPECGYTVRTTRVWIAQATPMCPIHSVEMDIE